MFVWGLEEVLKRSDLRKSWPLWGLWSVPNRLVCDRNCNQGQPCCPWSVVVLRWCWGSQFEAELRGKSGRFGRPRVRPPLGADLGEEAHHLFVHVARVAGLQDQYSHDIESLVDLPARVILRLLDPL